MFKTIVLTLIGQEQVEYFHEVEERDHVVIREGVLKVQDKNLYIYLYPLHVVCSVSVIPLDDVIND